MNYQEKLKAIQELEKLKQLFPEKYKNSCIEISQRIIDRLKKETSN